MEFRHITYFLKLAESTSISQAAGELYISQQALSKSISNLEQELGVRLFRRSSHGITLTRDGQYLKEQFAPVCREFSETLLETYSHFHIATGTMEFGVCPGFFRSIPVQYLIEYREANPQLHVEHLEYPDLDCENYVRANNSHFALSTRPIDMKGLRFIPLRRERLYVIAHKSHPLAKRTSVRLEELRNDRFLFFTDRYNIHLRTLKCCREAGFEPNIVYKSTYVSQLVSMAARNQGTFLCVRHVYEESSREDLVCIPLEDDRMFWELGIICQRADSLTQPAKEFIKLLEEHCNGGDETC